VSCRFAPNPGGDLFLLRLEQAIQRRSTRAAWLVQQFVRDPYKLKIEGE
jgi:hypothetical protein